MDGRFLSSILLLALLAGGVATWQYYNTIGGQTDDLRELRTLLANTQARLSRKKLDLEGIQAKFNSAQSVIDLDQQKKTLTIEITQLEAERSVAQQKLSETLQQVRSAAVGQDWSDVTLANGQVITEVKIQKCTESEVSLSHSGGVVKLNSKDLPEELRLRLGYGLSTVSATASP